MIDIIELLKRLIDCDNMIPSHIGIKRGPQDSQRVHEHVPHAGMPALFTCSYFAPRVTWLSPSQRSVTTSVGLHCVCWDMLDLETQNKKKCVSSQEA